MALQNDWIVAGINNPDFTVSDFANFADLTTENTQLLGVDDYIRTDFIQNCPYFRDDAGNFNEDLFRNYYASRAQEFDIFAQDEFYRGPALDMFDLDRTQETPVRDVGFNITRGFNPDRQQIGIEGVNVWSDPKFSQREIAKQNRVFNTERGEFEDWSVDDHTLVSNVKEWFNDLWRDPLVLATWDDDGVHVDPMTGLPQQHVKGQPKLNEKGTYYYETLGDRSVVGKDVLSLFDTFTVDGEGLNKYDFFDSNDLHKSVGGHIMKNIVSLIPLFIPGVSSVYSGVLLVRELTKTLPMLSGMVTSLTGGDTPQWAETASAWAQRMTTSMDDWSMQRPFSVGHFINLVSDLAMLTGQQQLIARGLGSLRGGQRYILEAQENAQRLFQSKALQYGAGPDVWRACLGRFMPQAERMAVKSGQLGRDLGLAYIALTFQHSTYDEMLQHGATKQEASAVALGAILGMFSVDKWLHLGEIFYNDATGSTTHMIRKIARDEVGKAIGTAAERTAAAAAGEGAAEGVVEAAKEVSRGALGELFGRTATKELGILKGIRKARDWAERTLWEHANDLRYHSLSVTGKMVGSGVERVAETLVGDLSKGLYELAGQFGAPTTVKDVGAFENMTDRYGMAFLAGVVGSGVHYATELVKRGTIAVPNNNESLVALVRNGYADELRKEVDRLEKAGRTGSRSVSATPIFGTEKGVEDKSTGDIIGWKTAEKGDVTQAKFVADLIRNEITAVEAVINGSEAGVTDEELFRNAVLGERRLMMYENASHLTDLYQRANGLFADYVSAERAYARALQTYDGEGLVPDPNRPGEMMLAPVADDDVLQHLTAGEVAVKRANEAKYKERVDEALGRIRSLTSGAGAMSYARELAFLLDGRISDSFMALDIRDVCREKYDGRDISDLSPAELGDLYKEYRSRRESMAASGDIEKAFSQFLALEKETAPILRGIEEPSKKYREWRMGLDGKLDEVMRMMGKAERLEDLMIRPEDRLQDESEDDYAHRATAKEGETDEQFMERARTRTEKIESANRAIEEFFVNNVEAVMDDVGWKVDTATKRRIRSWLENYGRPREVISRTVRGAGASRVVTEGLLGLDNDLGNVEAVVKGVGNAAADMASADLLSTVRGWYRRFAEQKVVETGSRGKDGRFVPGAGGPETREAYLYNYLNRAPSGADGKRPGGLTPRRLLDLMYAEDEMRSEGREFASVFDNMTDASRDEVEGLLTEFVGASGLGSEIIDGDVMSELTDVTNLHGDAIAKRHGEALEKFGREASAVEVQNANDVIRLIRGNGIMRLMERIRTEVRNPIEDMLNELAKSRGVDLPDGVTGVLRTIWDRYDSLKSVGEFYVDASLQNSIRGVKDLIRELRVYVEAASTVPDADNPIGHNRTINEFAERNAERLKIEWERLPEIRSDMAELYKAELSRTEEELDWWLGMSDRMTRERKGKILEMDSAISTMSAKSILDLGDEVTVGGQTYHLREGFGAIDQSDLNTGSSLRTQYFVDKKLYGNVERFAMSEGITVEDFFIKSQMWKNVGGWETIIDQRNVQLVGGLGEEMTPYAKIIYLATVLSERPDAYYADLAERAENGENVMPVGGQEIGMRIARALLTGRLGRMMSAVYDSLGETQREMLTRCIIAIGAAGVGKTYAVMGALAKLLEGKTVWFVGPSSETATRLAERFGRVGKEKSRVMTIDELIGAVVDEKDVAEMRAERNVKLGASGGIYEIGGEDREPVGEFDRDSMTYTTKHFTVEVDKRTNMPVTRLVPDSVKYMDIPEAERPDVVLIDEVTNVDTLDGLLVNGALENMRTDTKDPVCVMAGDFKQITIAGYTGMQSVEETSVFAVRTPELTLSLRNDNTQKYRNERAMRSVIDTMRNDMMGVGRRMGESEFNGNKDKYWNMMRAIRPEYYYDGKDINGTMFVERLDERLLGTLRALSTATDEGGRRNRVAYIGDKSSATLKALESAGVAIENVDVRGLDEMKGDEFAYVVVDQQLGERADLLRNGDEGTGSSDLLDTLRMIYTIDTRARRGTVVIDRNWSDFVGGSVESKVKGEAPSLDDVIADVRARKREVLGTLGGFGDRDKAVYDPKDETAAGEGKGVGGDEIGAGGGGDGGTPEEDVGIDGAGKDDAETPPSDDVVTKPKDTPPSGGGGGGGGVTEDGEETDAETPSIDYEPERFYADSETREAEDPYGQDVGEALSAMTGGDAAMMHDGVGGVEGEGGVTTDPTAGAGMLEVSAETAALADLPKGGPASKGAMYDMASYNRPLTGAEDVGEMEFTGKDGKKYRTRHAWRIRRPKSGPLRNMQALVGKDEVTLLRASDKRRIQSRLVNVMDAELFGRQYDDLPEWMREGDDRLVDREDWDDRAVVLEIRAVDGDEAFALNDGVRRRGPDGKWMNRVRGMNPFGMDDKGRFYMNYVLTFRCRAGDGVKRTAAIDLCGINDPETLAMHRESLAARFKERAQEAREPNVAGRKPDLALAGRLDGYADSVVEVSENYTGWFRSVHDAFVKNGRRPMVVDVTDKAVSDRRLWFERSEGRGIRLDGWRDPDLIDTKWDDDSDSVPENSNSFMMRYSPAVSVSPVYIAHGDRWDRAGLSPAIRNRACVAVDGDSNNDPGTAMQRYIAGRKAYEASKGKGHVPFPASVRLMMLDNSGLTLTQLNDLLFAEKVTGADSTVSDGGSDVRKPINQSQMGLEMFMALWNAREYVYDFNKRVEEWRKGMGYTREQLVALCAAKDIERTLPDWREQRRSALGNAGISTEESATENGFRVIDELDAFNEGKLSDMPFFRLGSYRNLKGRNYGFHVQRCGNVSAALYGDGTADRNMIYITAGAAERFERMLDAFLDPLTDGGARLFGLADERTAKDGTKSYVPWKKKTGRIINVKEHSGVLDSLVRRVMKGKGVVSFNGGEGAHNVRFANFQYYSLMTRFVRNLSYAAYSIDRNGGMRKGVPSTRSIGYSDILDLSGNMRSGSVEFRLNDMVPKAGEEGGTLSDMFEILFHGTMENVNRGFGSEVAETRTREEARRGYSRGRTPLPQVDGVRFPNGFLIQPGIEYTSDGKVAYKVQWFDGGGAKDTTIDFLGCNTHGAYFRTRWIPHKASMVTRADMLMDLVFSPEETFDAVIGRRSAERAKRGGAGKVVRPVKSDVDGNVVKTAEQERESPYVTEIGRLRAMSSGEGMAYGLAALQAMLEAEYGAEWEEEAPDSVMDGVDTLTLNVQSGGYDVRRVDDPSVTGRIYSAADASGAEVARLVHDDSVEEGTAVVAAAYEIVRGGAGVGTRVVLRENFGEAAGGGTPESVPEPASEGGGAPSESEFVLERADSVNGTKFASGLDKALADMSGDGFLGMIGARKYADDVGSGKVDLNDVPDSVGEKFVRGLFLMRRAGDKDEFLKWQKYLNGNDAFFDYKDALGMDDLFEKNVC